MIFEASDTKIGGLLVFAAHVRVRRQAVAASSNGQDAVLSRLRWEFNSPRCYQEFVCLNGVIGGVMPGRSMAGRESLKLVMSVRPPQHVQNKNGACWGPRFDSLPGSQICCELKARSGEGYGYFSFKEKHRN